MNILKISAISIAFLALWSSGSVFGQSNEGGENYYSNPKIGKKAPKMNVYTDNNVVTKSEDLKIEILGEDGDSVVNKDSIQGTFDQEQYYDYEYSARINRFHRGMGWNYYDDYYTNMYWYNADPWFWGSSIYWGPSWGHYGYWNPYWSNGWAMTYGWGYNPYSWGWGPHWGCSWYLGNGWSIGWGWGYDPFWDPYWGYGYGYGYGWYDPYFGGGYMRPGMNNNWGHAYLGDQARSRGVSYPTGRGPSATPTRRGGVDLNGRGAGMQPSGRGGLNAAQGNSLGRTPVSGATRYSKPESVTNNRHAMSIRSTNGRSDYSSTSSTSRTNSTGYRTGTSSPTTYRSSSSSSMDRSSSFNSGSTSSRSSYSSGSSSSRSSYGGSSSVRSSSYGGGSSSRSSYGGGSSHSSSSHSSGGSSHSSGGGRR